MTSIHRPELCLPGQGWKIQSEHTQSHPRGRRTGWRVGCDAHERLSRRVRCQMAGSAEARSVFAYWFVGKDRMTPYHWQRIYWTAKDRVLYNTNHRWAYILIHVPIRSDVGTGEPPSRKTMP